jgi:hypothetical protein
MSVVFDESPTAVRIGERTFQVGPLRVRHLAALERQVLAERVNPAAQLPELLAGLDERQQELLLTCAYDALVRPPRVEERELEAYLATRCGLAEALWQSIRELEAGADRDEFSVLLDALPADQWGDLEQSAVRALRISWGNRQGQSEAAAVR